MKKILTLICLTTLISFQTFADVNYFFDGFTRKNTTWVGKESTIDWWANMKWLYGEWSAGGHQNECLDNLWHVSPGYADWNWSAIRPANVDLDECVFKINDEVGLTSKIDIYEWEIFEHTNQLPGLVMDASFQMAVINIPASGNPSDLVSTGLSLHAELDINTNSAVNLAIFLNRKNVSNATIGTTLYYTNVAFTVGNTLSLNFNTNTASVSYGGNLLFDVNHHLKNVEQKDWYVGYCVQNVETARAEYFFDNAEIITPGAKYDDILEDSFTGNNGDRLNSNIWFLTSYSPSQIQNNMCRMQPTNLNWQGTMMGYKSDLDNSLRFEPNFSELEISLQTMNVEIIETGTWSAATTILKTEFFPERSRAKSYDYNSTNLSVESLMRIVGGGATQINFKAIWYSKAEQQNTFWGTNLWFIPGATCTYHLTQTEFSLDYGDCQSASAPHTLNIPEVFPKGVFVTHRTENGSDGRGVVYIDDLKAQIIPEPSCLLFAIASLLFFNVKKYI